MFLDNRAEVPVLASGANRSRRCQMIKRYLNRAALGTLAVLLVSFGLIQFVPVDRSNPEVGFDITTSPEVKAILKRSCYDCHSNETVWPWYSSVAPVSWLVAWDLHKGREEVNLSTWSPSPSQEHAKIINACWKEVSEGEMPPRTYVSVHPEARLSAEDRRVLQAWARELSPVTAER
jgi:hypothetical protein